MKLAERNYYIYKILLTFGISPFQDSCYGQLIIKKNTKIAQIQTILS